MYHTIEIEDNDYRYLEWQANLKGTNIQGLIKQLIEKQRIQIGTG